MQTTEFVCMCKTHHSYIFHRLLKIHFVGVIFPNNYVFFYVQTHQLDFKQHGRERESWEVFLLVRDGLNNDAVNFSKHFNPKYVIKMSQMKRVMKD